VTDRLTDAELEAIEKRSKRAMARAFPTTPDKDRQGLLAEVRRLREENKEICQEVDRMGELHDRLVDRNTELSRHRNALRRIPRHRLSNEEMEDLEADFEHTPGGGYDYGTLACTFDALLAEYRGLRAEYWDLRARLSLYEPPEGERDETQVCPECGSQHDHHYRVECHAYVLASMHGDLIPMIPRWRYELGENIKRGEVPK